MFDGNGQQEMGWGSTSHTFTDRSSFNAGRQLFTKEMQLRLWLNHAVDAVEDAFFVGYVFLFFFARERKARLVERGR